MNIVFTLLLVLQIGSAVAMIGLILVQHGKGADAGAAFGSGGAGSASLFGASGSANFLSRTTAVLATIFLVSTLMLASIGSKRAVSTGSVLEGVAVQPAATPSPASNEAPTPATGAAQIPGK
ncbi:MAG TPA: preprotein translocase subunit SecG [Burkholderiaceae bacterium]|nr:preprotein translocase subunit SecG [Burkholderiaceae bacterium]